MFHTASRKLVLLLLVAIELSPARFVDAAPTEQQAVLEFDAAESQPQSKPSQQRKLHGRFLHITGATGKPPPPTLRFASLDSLSVSHSQPFAAHFD